MKIDVLIEYLKQFSPKKEEEKKVFFVTLSAYVPWHLTHSLSLSKVLNKLGYSIDYFMGNNQEKLEPLYRFNARKIIKIQKIKSLIVLFFQIVFFNVKYARFYFDMNKLVKLNIQGVYVGDLIYDDFTRRQETSTIDKMTFSYFLKVNEAYFYYLFYRKVLIKNQYDLIVTNHNCYIRNGMLARVAQELGLKVLLYITTEDGYSLRKQYLGKSDVYTFYTIANQKLFYKSLQNKALMKKADEFFFGVMNKTEETCDKINFNISSTQTNQDDLEKLQQIKQNSNKKIVVIASHVMVDNITGADGRKLVYKDVYIWLEETLKLCSKNPNIITYLKPHPREYAFKYTPTILDVFNRLNLKNIYLWPQSVDMKTNHTLIDAFITIRGSVSFEFPCFGIPVIAAGKDHAGSSGFGTTFETDSVAEYQELIQNIHQLTLLDHETVQKAKLVYFMYYKTFIYYIEEQYIPKMSETYKEEYVGVDPKLLPVNPYRGNSVDIVLNKLKHFDTLYGEDYFNDIKAFFSDDDIVRLSEIQYIRNYLHDHE